MEEIFVGGDENGGFPLGVGKQLVVCGAGRKNFQRVNSGVSGGLQLNEGGARKIFVEEKVHALNLSAFDAFHRGQAAGKFQTRADVQIFE